MTTPATQTLAGYIVNASFENLPPDVVEKAKLCLMDSVGAFSVAIKPRSLRAWNGFRRISPEVSLTRPVRIPPGRHFITRLWPTPLTLMTSTGRGIPGRQWLLPHSRLPTARAPQGAT